MSRTSRKQTTNEMAASQDDSAPERMPGFGQSQASGAVLRTKLMPPRLHGALVARPALFARLDAGLDRRLTLVTAPTGFGKTTLVGQWLAERKIPYAWVTLDEGDNDPVRFWSYAITALRGLEPALGKTALAMLRTTQQPALHAILTSLINELAGLEGDRVLVLEDYHAITSPEVHDTLGFLLNHLPGTLHLVLVSRSEPGLPLGILRARDELVEIEPASLRFTPEEMAAFFQQSGQAALSPAALARLEERTEGWPAGLRLAALALQGKSSPPEAEQVLADFSGTHRYMLEYLVSEVFAGLPEQVQSFLLRTSMLERFCLELVEEVVQEKSVFVEPLSGIRKEQTQTNPESPITELRKTSSVQHLLDYLSRSNLFITRLETTGDQPWYRYHPLFAEAIRYRARQVLGESELRAISERASHWHERKRMLDEAVEYALRASLFDRAAELVERQAETNSMNGLITLRRWAGMLPIETLERRPELCFQYAQSILYTSDRFSPAVRQQIEPLMQITETAWRAAKDNRRLGEVLAFRAMVAFWQGEPHQAFSYAGQSLELLPEDAIGARAVDLLFLGIEQYFMGRLPSALERTMEARALFGALQNPHGVQAALQAICEIYILQAALEPAAQIAQQVLDEVSVNVETFESMQDDQGFAWLALGRICYEQNDLETAAQYTRQALEVAEKRGNEQLIAQASIHQARIQSTLGHPAQALSELQALSARVRSPAQMREVKAAQAWIALDVGDTAPLGAWRAAVQAPGASIYPMQQEREALVLARLHIAENEPAKALSLLETWHADAAAQGRARSEVEILCLEALAHQAAGAMQPAAQALTRALAIAQSRGLRRLLLDFGPGLLRLLAQVAPSLGKRSLVVYAAALQQSALIDRAGRAAQTASPGEAAADQQRPAQVEPLSPQELRVLRLLAAGLSNPEIAREMVVSINTIKTQVQSIYRKLNVTSREEARQAALDLKIK